MAGLDPIGTSAAGLLGFFVHTVLSVRWPDAPQDTSKRRPGEVLGIGDPHYKVAHYGQAHACALQYAIRWMIEQYHKAIKTGLGAERRQQESAARWCAAIAIMSVGALRLIELRERLRRHPDVEAA
jgi:hypothetical protein